MKQSAMKIQIRLGRFRIAKLTERTQTEQHDDNETDSERGNCALCSPHLPEPAEKKR